MSFGNKQLDRAFDDWKTQTPEDYFHENESDDVNNVNNEKCCLCGCKLPEKHPGLNNPAPLAESNLHCCDKCNMTKVIPERLRRLSQKTKMEQK